MRGNELKQYVLFTAGHADNSAASIKLRNTYAAVSPRGAPLPRLRRTGEMSAGKGVNWGTIDSVAAIDDDDKS